MLSASSQTQNDLGQWWGNGERLFNSYRISFGKRDENALKLDRGDGRTTL